MGARVEPDRRHPRTGNRCAAGACRGSPRAGGGQRPGEERDPARRPPGRGRDHRRGAAADPGPHRTVPDLARGGDLQTSGGQGNPSGQRAGDRARGLLDGGAGRPLFGRLLLGGGSPGTRQRNSGRRASGSTPGAPGSSEILRRWEPGPGVGIGRGPGAAGLRQGVGRPLCQV